MSSSEEIALIEEVAVGLQSRGLDVREARKQASELVVDCRNKLGAAGLLDVGPIGSLMLQGEREGTLPSDAANLLSSLRKDGVSDNDIEWWHNMSSLRRQVEQKSHEMFRLQVVMSFIEEDEHFSSEKDLSRAMSRAVTRYRKVMPWFGQIGEPATFDPQDRNLPYALRRRVTAWVVSGGGKVPVQSSTANAYIRSGISSGAI